MVAHSSQGVLRVIPLGGLGEVGMNCLALEQPDGVLVIDCGVTFPDDDRGVNLLHPSFDYLESMRDRVVGVFLTHGHEDHIGALPYLLTRLPVPVWGPPHALELAHRRVRDRTPRQNLKVDFRRAIPGETYSVGPFAVEPIRVSHSIVEATALRIETAAGTVVHTGDFKFDPNPADGQPTDEERLERVGDDDVALLLSDSTNIHSSGAAGSEQDVAEALDELVGKSRERVVVGLFSSNVQRLINLGRIARRHGRRIGLLGRSLEVHVDAATRLGYLDWGSEHRVLGSRLSACPRSELLLLAGGTQAEAGSGLSRLARGTHSALRLDAGDRVILSSRIIPGNGRKVSGMMGDLVRLGVDLHSGLEHRSIHTSGHANRQELAHMLQLIRPSCFLPVHGTRHHLEGHAQLARELGVSECLVIEDGQVAKLDGGKLELDGTVPSGPVFLDRGSQRLSHEVLRQRGSLGRCGLAQLILVLDEQRNPIGDPRLLTLGVPGFEEERAGESLESEVAEHYRKYHSLWAQRQQSSARQLERFLGWRLERLLGRRPLVKAALIEPPSRATDG